MIVRYDRHARTFTAFGDNLMDVEAWLRGTDPVWTVRGSIRSAATDSWDLSAGWQGALDLARKGWSDGARELHQLLQAADIRNDKAKIERWGVAGYAPDVPRYLAGDPAHMRARSRNPDVTHKPIVNMVYNITANANVSAKSLALMGSAMAAVVDQLETKGRRVDLSVAFSANHLGAGGKFRTGWRVKHAEDHVDLAAIAFSVAHPAAMRRLGFAMVERSPFELQTPSYGSSVTCKASDLPNVEPDALMLDGLSGPVSRPGSVVSAVALLAAQINQAAGFEMVETTVKI